MACNKWWHCNANTSNEYLLIFAEGDKQKTKNITAAFSIKCIANKCHVAYRKSNEEENKYEYMCSNCCFSRVTRSPQLTAGRAHC